MQGPYSQIQSIVGLIRLEKLTLPAFLHSLRTAVGKGLLIPKGIADRGTTAQEILSGIGVRNGRSRGI